MMLTLKEAAARDGAFSTRYLQKLCRNGRIKAAVCHAGTWFLADDYKIEPSVALKGRPPKKRLEPRSPV